MKRTAFVLTASAAAAVPALAQTPATVRIQTNPIDSGAEVYYAHDLGLFAKAGIDAEIQPGRTVRPSPRR